MIGLIVVTHSNFADGIKNSVEMIAGKQLNFESICFENGEDIEDLQDRILSVAQRFSDDGNSVIYLTDMIGASPFNACVSVATKVWGPVISGVCLPMLLEFILTRDITEEKNLSNYARNVITNVKESIQVIDINDLM